MTFLIDECLHTSLVDVARVAGHAAFHVVHLGIQGSKDYELFARVIHQDFTFVTNNAADFRLLYQSSAIHAGLIIIVPNVAPSSQRRLFQAALDELREDELVNGVLEVSIEDAQIVVKRYQLPKE